MKRLAILLAAAILALAAPLAVAAITSTGAGAGSAGATSVSRANQPTAAPGGGEVVLDWAPSLLTSGDPVGGYRVLRHEGDTTTTVCTTTSPLVTCSDTSPASGAVTYGVVATIGDHWSGPESELASYTHDSLAPTTGATITPFPRSGWNNSDVTVDFEASDTGSGVRDLTVDGVTTPGASASKAVTAEGTTTFPYFATDNAGNVEDSGTATVRIDRTAPLSTMDPADSLDWFTVFSKSVTIDATDIAGAAGGNSGVAAVRYSIDGGPQVEAAAPVSFSLPEGAHTVTYSAIDVAGNEEATRTARIRVDNTDPFNLAISPLSSTTQWRTSSALSFSAEDAVSGVYAILYRVNGTSRPNLLAPYATTLPEGTNAVTYQAVDNAGNITNSILSATIKVDTHAPTTTLSQTGAGPATLAASDGNDSSGVATIFYRVGSTGAFTAASGNPATLSLANGTHTLWFYAVDSAGNQEAPQSRSVTIGSADTTAPTTTITDLVESGSYTSQNSGTGSWAKVCGDGRICATVTDAGSGVNAATVSYTLTGLSGAQNGKCWSNGSWVTGSSCVGTMTQSGGTWTATHAVSRNGAQGMNAGSYRVLVRATDNAGNQASTTITFTTF